jgi:hypothetical protein
VRSTKARWKKLKKFSITLTEPIFINLVSNRTNKLNFHYQKANYLSKIQKLSERIKRLLNLILIKKSRIALFFDFLAAYL